MINNNIKDIKGNIRSKYDKDFFDTCHLYLPDFIKVNGPIIFNNYIDKKIFLIFEKINKNENIEGLNSFFDRIYKNVKGYQWSLISSNISKEEKTIIINWKKISLENYLELIKKKLHLEYYKNYNIDYRPNLSYSHNFHSQNLPWPKILVNTDIDAILFSKTSKKFYIIEIKTLNNSIKVGQFNNLINNDNYFKKYKFKDWIYGWTYCFRSKTKEEQLKRIYYVNNITNYNKNGGVIKVKNKELEIKIEKEEIKNILI